MKRIALMTLAAIAALTVGLKAQGTGFDELYKSLPQPVAADVQAAPAPAAAQPAPQAAPVQRDWLVAVFINGVNDLGILGFANKSINDMEKVGSTDRMAVVVEYGILGQDGAARNLQFQRGSKSIYITRDNDDQKITSPAYLNTNTPDMGSAAHLERFVKSAVRRYPASHIAVIVWNHGGGRLGISWDDVSKNHMEVDQLGRSLARISQVLGRKIDLFATDACLMQMAGVAYELKDSAGVIVGSEEVIPGDSYPYDQFLGPLAADPGMDAERLGALMVDAYAAYYTGTNSTLSALRSAALPGFVRRMNAWVSAVNADPKARKAALSAQTVNATYNFQMRDSRDLVDYLDNVDSLLPPKSQAARDAAAALRDYVEKTLLIKDSALVPNAHGLAVYIPDLRYNSANYEKLLFARDSLWDDLLREMMEERLKQP